MDFSGLLKKHYDESQQKALICFLLEQQLFQLISDTTERFFASDVDSNQNELLKRFGNDAAPIITRVSQWLSRQETGGETNHNSGILFTLLLCLTTEALHYTRLKPHDIYPEINALVMADPYLAEHHRCSFYRFTDMLQEKCLKTPPPGEIPISNPHNSQSVYFIWQGFPEDKENHISLCIFLDDLITLMPGLRPRKYVSRLFEAGRSDYKITLPSHHLLCFLALFHHLHSCHRIVCKNNRGLFVHLKEHLQPPPNDFYPDWKDFAKLLHKELSLPQNRLTICKTIKPLCDKYCNGKLF